MSNINSLDREAKEYFYSLPLATQDIIKASDMEITCREDIQRYFTNVINPTNTPILTNKPEGL
ncbi:MAG: hypothetical protein UHY68_04590 [Acutalibacteraceae bacterium]|nr:hypothetical protein [Acutalibacteraceae bacterium]